MCNIIHFFPQPDSQSHLIKFIWASEMSGFRHLYLVNVDSSQETYINDLLSQCEPTFHQFTSGDWEVDGNKVCITFDPTTVQCYYVSSLTIITIIITDIMTALKIHRFGWMKRRVSFTSWEQKNRLLNNICMLPRMRTTNKMLFDLLNLAFLIM